MTTRHGLTSPSFTNKCFHTAMRATAQWLFLALAVCAWTTQARADATSVVLKSFDYSWQPQGALVKGDDGTLYGTTSFGGTADNGTVFSIAADGTFTTLHEFPAFTSVNSIVNTGGGHPWSTLVFGADGTLYGTTYKGGKWGVGTAFKITTAGTLTTLHEFGGPEDDEYPQTGLVLGPGGDFYGTTTGGGTSGTLFRMTPQGVVTTLHSFCDGGDCSDGYDPEGELVVGLDGNLYGTAEYGGIGYGTVFKITPDGVFTPLHSFDHDTGAQPMGPLVQDTDGKFYGTTYAGGAFGQGTVYKMTSTGDVTVLHSFPITGTSSDGITPTTGLLLASDGNLYGTTRKAGDHGAGTVFRITPAGDFSVIYTFTNHPDAAFADGELIEGPDGTLYGTTSGGGTASGGTVYKLINALGTALPAPAQVTGLAATAGNAEVQLSWSAVTGAGGYTVRRGTASGAETTIATNVAETSYAATGLDNGTTYYFTVAATNSSGTGADSAEVSATPTAGQAAAPSFAPPGGSYTTAQSVTISAETTDAQIYYTTDGSTPTTASTLYTGAIDVSASETLKAMTVADGYTNSAVVTASYTISSGSSSGGSDAPPPSSNSGGGGGATTPIGLVLLLALAAWRRRREPIGVR